MEHSTSPALKQLMQQKPGLYRKLCFWAARRGLIHPTQEVNHYLTELVLETDTHSDRVALLQRWSKVLSPQERLTLAQISPISIADCPGGADWYALQKGEYSIMDEPILHEICHQGAHQASITRNRYECLVLNANNSPLG
jgi:hypothetical protein